MRVFVDTCGWIAHFLPGDQHRQDWLDWLDASPEAELVTSDAVVVETLNLLKRKGVHGFHLAEAGNQLWRQDIAVLEQATDADYTTAMGWFAKFEDQQDVSFTDSLSYAMMLRLELRQIVSFDAHFSLFPQILRLP